MSASIIGWATFCGMCIPALLLIAASSDLLDRKDRAMARIVCAMVLTVSLSGLAYCIARLAGVHA